MAVSPLPYDDLMERNCLGAALNSEQRLADIMAVLPTPDCFYNPLHREIYRAMLELQADRMPADIVTLSSRLDGDRGYKNAGGISYLSMLQEDCAFPARAENYAKEVYNKALLRQVIETADEIKSDASSQNAKSEFVISNAAQKLFSLGETGRLGSVEIITPILKRTIEEMIRQNENADSSRRVKTGFPRLDKALGGLGNGTLNVLAARPSIGKSSLALNIAHNAALFFSHSVAFFSLEMSKEEIAKRFLSSRGQVESQRFLDLSSLKEKDWDNLKDAAGAFKNRKIFIDDTAGLSPTELIARCRRLKSQGGLDLVIIDYLQLMSMKGRKESRQQEISEISRMLKLLAKDLDLAVLALSQLSREAEKHEDTPRPKLSDLRESGSIEQDADTVMLLYKERLENKEGQTGAEKAQKNSEIELIIAKNRNGPTKTIRLGWIPEYTLFIEPERDRDEFRPSAPPDAGNSSRYDLNGEEQSEVHKADGSTLPL